MALSKFSLVSSALLCSALAWPTLAHATEIRVPLKEGMDTTFIDEPHHLTVIGDGVAALDMRLRLIAEAKSSILIASHTFDPDRSGRVVLQALARRVAESRQNGVPFQALVLVDGLGTGAPGLDLTRMAELKAAGIELRYFRPVRLDPALLLQGTHRKLFIKDRDAFIIGGRNVGDKYFEINEDRNAFDRDMLVEGPIAARAADAFFEFWDNPLSSTAKPMLDAIDDVIAKIDHKPNPDNSVLTENDGDRTVAAEVERVGDPELAEQSPAFDVTTIRFVTDGPSGTKRSRVVTPVINKWLGGAMRSLVGEQLYFHTLADRRRLFQERAKEGVEITLFTNSKASSPDELSDLSFVYVDELIKLTTGSSETKMEAALLAGSAPERERPAWSSANYMIHTKTWVRDHEDSWISSYNMDSVSAEHNAEAAVIIPNTPLLAATIEADMKSRRDLDGSPFVRGTPDTERFDPYAGLSAFGRIKQFWLLMGSELIIHEL